MKDAIFAGLGVTFAAFCIWLTVRIVDRRERWAKRLAQWLVILLLTTGLYGMSIGPAFYVVQRLGWSGGTVSTVYRPVILALAQGPRPVRKGGLWYVSLWI